jgi:hypothetical protein
MDPQAQYQIFQLKKDSKHEERLFWGTEQMINLGFIKGTEDILPEDYECLYTGDPADIYPEWDRNVDKFLEEVYAKFNLDRPEDFKGHSLSVGDIITITEDSVTVAEFVDSTGFTLLPEFAVAMMEEEERQSADSGREI